MGFSVLGPPKLCFWKSEIVTLSCCGRLYVYGKIMLSKTRLSYSSMTAIHTHTLCVDCALLRTHFWGVGEHRDVVFLNMYIQLDSYVTLYKTLNICVHVGWSAVLPL